MFKTICATAALLAFCLAASCGGGGGSSGSNGNGGSGGTQTTDSSHGTATCPAGNAIFSVTPVPMANIYVWEPLGNLNPSGHTFPTDHQYVYIQDPANPSGPVTVNVSAPADMRIFDLYSTTGAETGYTIFFQPCAQVIGRMSVASLSPDILAAAAGSINQNCMTYSPSQGSTLTQCEKSLTYDVKAGQTIGTIAKTGGFYALDFYLWDTRSPDIHFTDSAKFANFGGPPFTEPKIVAASDYYVASLAPAINAKLGGFMSTAIRTAAPLGGTIAIDVDGTARGYWFNPNQVYPPEIYHAALAPDNISPATLQAFSFGISQANIATVFSAQGFVGVFTPVTTGQVNRAFETVTSDGNTYCYETGSFGNSLNNRVVLLQMPDANTLKAEVLGPSVANCAAAQPWTFSSFAVTYKR